MKEMEESVFGFYKELMFVMVNTMLDLMEDIEKADTVKVSSQRARVKTIKLQKLFKAFRKESVKHFKERANERNKD